MPTAIKKEAGNNHQYEFTTEATVETHPLNEWAHDPDISSVANVSRVYWKWDGTAVIEMTQAEKDIVDDYGMEALDEEGNSIRLNISTDLPKSTIDGKKLSVHSSYKPEVDGFTTYAIWSGSGDDMNATTGGNGGGPLLQIDTEVGVPTKSVDIEFDYDKYGQVWIHEAYIKFSDGGSGDYITSEVYAYGVPLQQVANLDLVLDGDYIKYSAGGPGTGTHGFADADKITLIDRSYSKDGAWDYDENGLTPNFTNTGNFKMSTTEKIVHRFINKIPCYGTCTTYVSMSSDETSELRKGYFARLTAHNISDTVWHVSALMELYRVVTYSEEI